MKKDKKDIEKAKSHSDELNNILEDIVKDDNIINRIDNELNLNKKQKTFIDFEKIYNDCVQEAKDTIESMAKFHLSEESLKEDHIRDTIKNDVLILISQTYLVKSTINAIKTLSEQIDSGDYNVRNFEALGNLNRSQTEATGRLLQIKIILENKYRDLSDNYEKQTKKLPESSFKVLGSGHKAMLETLKNSEKQDAGNI